MTDNQFTQLDQQPTKRFRKQVKESINKCPNIVNKIVGMFVMHSR
jgi:hypothetical protein